MASDFEVPWNAGDVTAHLNDLSAITLKDIRTRWPQLVEELDPPTAAGVACSLAVRFPNNGFFEAQAISLARGNGFSLPVARTLIDLVERGHAIPLHPVTLAWGVIENDATTSDDERERVNQLYDRLIEASPRRHFFRAVRFRRMGERDAAIEEVQTYLKSYPDDREAIILGANLALSTGRIGRYAHMFAALEPHLNVANAQQAWRLYDSFARAQGLDPRNPDEVTKHEYMMESPGGAYEAGMALAPPPSKEIRQGVAFLIGSLAGGGAERVVATTIHTFRNRQSEENVELLLLSKTAGPAGDPLFYLPLTGLSEDELVIIEPSVETTNPFSWLPPFYAPRAQAIYEHLLKTQPRVFYISLDEAVIAGGLAAVMAGVPEIIIHCHNMSPPSLHGSDTHSFGWNRAYKALLSHESVRYINVSKTALDDYIAWIEKVGPLSRERLSVIHNGVDFSEMGDVDVEFIKQVRKNLGIPFDAPVVGAALRFTEVKQPLVWLDTVKLIHGEIPNAHFVMYGDGVLQDECKAYAKNLGLDGVVHFPGRVSDLAKRLPLFDILMLSSRSEGFPNVLIEGQAAGAVPVTFDVGGCHETFEAEKTGLIVTDKTATALAHAVVSLLSEPARLEKMQIDGRSFVLNNFSLEHTQGQLLDIVFPDKSKIDQTPALRRATGIGILSLFKRWFKNGRVN